MNRRGWITRSLSLCAALFVWPLLRLSAGSALAEEAKQQATLRERLKAGLLCRRDEEKAFVDLVADKVEAGELPQELALNTMKYALKKRPKFPFFYFQYAIERQAAVLGVNL